MKKVFLFILAIAAFQISAQDTLHVVQFAGIGALTKTVVAGESLQAGEAVYINPTSKKAFRADHTLAPSKADAQAICLWDAPTDSTTLIITSGRITDWPEVLNIGETYYLSDTLGYISQYPSNPAQKIGIAVDSFVLDVQIQKPSEPGFKSYAAIVTQSSSSAPGEVLSVNTLDDTPVWNYIGSGNYTLTCTGCFTADKTMIFAGPMNTWPFDGSTCFSLSAKWVDADTIEFKAFRCSDSGALDDVFNLSIEIRVYP
jgi:hypothetical protein